MPRFKPLRLLATLVLVSACASSGATAGGTVTTASNRSIITNEEIPATGTESAYDLIQRLRPEFLRTKPAQSYVGANSNEAPPPVVFFHGQRIGDLADLRRIPAPSLSMIHYYNIEEGKRKFGMQYGGGVIEIAYRTP